jgi:ribosomal protein S18 acetylase RimI-like enzyme
MTVGDIDAVRTIGHAAPELAVSEVSKFWAEHRLKPWVEANQDIMLVAELEGAVVGAILTQVHKPSKVCYLSDLVVKSSEREKGIGRKLLVATLEKAHSAGFTLFYGLTQVNNRAIQSLLKSEGFSVGEELIWYEKRIK